MNDSLSSKRKDWQLKDWLDYLESVQPIKYNLRLENVREVAKRLGLISSPLEQLSIDIRSQEDTDLAANLSPSVNANPPSLLAQRNSSGEESANSSNILPPVITVGGTNGKGSTVAALVALFNAEGYRVGHFTSPHLIKFNERICINNQQISDYDATIFMQEIDDARGDLDVSYFEAALLCALLYFKSNNLDLIVLEVGMGGRLDATNIIDADLTIITSIALDHQKYLGNDTYSIGREKSGIMRTGKYCIFADDSRPASIDNHAKNIDCELICLGEDYNIKVDNDRLEISYKQNKLLLPKPQINPKAAASAVIATFLLADILPLSSQSLEKGMLQIQILGRQQLIYKDQQKIILDVSHNPHGVMYLAQYLKNMSITGKVHAIFSGLAEKDLHGMIEPLVSIIDNWYPTVMHNKRAASMALLQEVFNKVLKVDSHICYDDLNSAYKSLTKNYAQGDLIVIYGSFFLVGEFLANNMSYTQ